MTNEYIQPVVWLGVVLGDGKPEEFEDYFKNEFGFRVKYTEEFVMQDGDFEGLHCTIFHLHKDDISKFAIWRLMRTDFKWLEDWIDNRGLGVPISIIRKYGDKGQLKKLLQEQIEMED